MRPLILLASVLLVACGGGVLDFDGDGIPDASDCAPEDPERGAALDPFGDGIDQNCDGTDGIDADGDGHSADDSGGTDCDDANDDVHPDAEEVCDGADNNCDGEPGPDEGDGDGDGSRPCDGDCDDSDATRHPRQPESCNGIDDDCDGYVPSNEQDLDEDGQTPCEGDCNDAVASIFEASLDDHPELCNGFDDNCDGLLGEDEEDLDGDGFAPCEGDCDDANLAWFPGNGLWDDPSGIDTNCDAVVGIEPARIGDADGDGVDDLVVGANWSDAAAEAAGELWFVSGADVLDSDAITVGSVSTASWTGELAHDFAGWSASPAGDVDNDGRADVLVGAYGDDTHGPLTGRTYLLLGSQLAEGGSLADAFAVFVGEDGYDESGWAFDSAGDVEGDGVDDLIFGGYDVDEPLISGGKGYIFFAASIAAGGTFSLGEADVILQSEQEYSQLGWWAAGIGDIDGGGLDDVAIAAPYSDASGGDAGSVYVFLGESVSSGGIFDAASADVILRGEDSSDHLGRHLASAGDVDGDGLADLIVGARWNDVPYVDGGRAYLWLGSARRWRWAEPIRWPRLTRSSPPRAIWSASEDRWPRPGPWMGTGSTTSSSAATATPPGVSSRARCGCSWGAPWRLLRPAPCRWTQRTPCSTARRPATASGSTSATARTSTTTAATISSWGPGKRTARCRTPVASTWSSAPTDRAPRASAGRCPAGSPTTPAQRTTPPRRCPSPGRPRRRSR
ncbi:MAG: hypothetical protein GY898_10810 [Proteobacteria bacterium]|nr:hypothetical protein [Pseudomonadota bacterium]